MVDHGLLCRRWLISGRVQGVGFRWFVRRTASGLGLVGFVRNLQDGQVEVVARGPETGLARLEATLRQGPSGARVTNIDVGPAQLPEDAAGFHISS